MRDILLKIFLFITVLMLFLIIIFPNISIILNKNLNDYITKYFTLNPDTTIIITKVDSLDQQRKIEIQLIRIDLNEYPELSNDIKDEIANSILETSKIYNIPPQLMHAIFQIESNYKFNIDHPNVTIIINGKQVKTCARGLGGIIWEVWKSKLINEKIATTASDLYIPKVNILATGFILRLIIDDELTKNRKEWIVSRIIAQYYGRQSQAYESRMLDVTSSLWLKRISREIYESKNFNK